MRMPRKNHLARGNPVEADRIGEDGAAQGVITLPVETPLTASFDGSDGTMCIETPVLTADGCNQAFMLRLTFSAEAVDGFLRALDAFDRTTPPIDAGVARTRRH
jgi:hypothetical protein